MSAARAPCLPRLLKLRGVFFGTSEFAVPSLQRFAQAVDCALVVTQPDRPAGRGQRLRPTPVKRAAEELAIASIEPERLHDATGALRAARPEVFGVAAYGKIVPQAILVLASRGALNVHPSLLPLYRGATPLQSQLRDGVTHSGVTVILMDAGMDTGDVVVREERAIGPAETFGELHDRFAVLGAEMLARACAALAAGRLAANPQAGCVDPAEIARTLTHPFQKADLILDWRLPADRIVDTVRAFSPVPAARATLPGEAQTVKILKAHAVDVAPAQALAVPAGDGRFVVIEQLVPPNRAALSGAAYFRAHHRSH